jgi:hypothetical protein
MQLGTHVYLTGSTVATHGRGAQTVMHGPAAVRSSDKLTGSLTPEGDW